MRSRIFLVSVCIFHWGCMSAARVSGSDDHLASLRKDSRITHEACEPAADSERLDANGDGRPDITIVFDSGVEACRILDLNFDGLVDVWVFRDPKGRVRRKESDYDRDGRVDEIALFRDGVLAERQRSTSLANRLDTWQYFRSGVLVRTERDSDGNDIIDQWWEYPSPNCPVIHADLDGDGRPERDASVDYCKETDYVPPERHTRPPPVEHTFERIGGDAPTEVKSEDGVEMEPGSADPAPNNSAAEGAE